MGGGGGWCVCRYYAVITLSDLLQMPRPPAVNKRSPKQKVLIRCVSVGEWGPGGGLGVDARKGTGWAGWGW